ncbi:polyamine aminopropyltransferase [Thiotrichales bacterium 19S3-7]|nr:polyamine aminopropyltransferase [Thiotrichales bacterium 19S3-7]MCF6802735.1 polyamine aminopropyltransferase [Thiotrichales bacterium 19S3-11]
MTKKFFRETLHQGYAQGFEVKNILFENKSDFQHLVIFENPHFGRVMALDGIIQTTEKDEFIYHEMLTHTPIIAHGNAEDVLIIGGGDGGILREVLKHSSIKRVTLVEIDKQVIDMCTQYFPNHSNGAFEDPRVNIVIDDGLAYVNHTKNQYDIIISDSTDPIGPGEALFTNDFYQGVYNCLKDNGIFVCQNGVSFFQLDEVTQTANRLKPLFKDVSFYNAAVPTYVGGIMTFGYATDNLRLRQQSLDIIQTRFKSTDLNCRYYTPEIHVASFALPQYVLDAI